MTKTSKPTILLRRALGLAERYQKKPEEYEDLITEILALTGIRLVTALANEQPEEHMRQKIFVKIASKFFDLH